MARQGGSVHVDTRPRTYRAKDGSVREYRQALLRRSFRNAAGKPSKETLANLSALPDVAIDAIRKILAGKTLVDVEESFTVERSLAHGHVGAVHVMASQLRFAELLGPPCPERDTAYALILSRVVAPRSKLATTHGGTIQAWGTTSVSSMLTPMRRTPLWIGSAPGR